jgi:PAS domain-containing protein
VAHLEMSLTDPFTPVAPSADAMDFASRGSVRSVDRWIDAVDGANEACLVIDAAAVISAASHRACELLGFASPEDAAGQCLYDGVLPLLDFTSAATPLPDAEISKVPPVQALRSKRLARGLIRVRAGREVMTVDAIATPLWEHDVVVGSLTFFCEV